MGLQNTPKLAKIGGALDPGRLSRSGQIRSILSRPPGFGQSFEWWEGAPPFGMVVRLRSAPWASVGFSAWAGSAPGASRPPLRQPTPKIRLKPTPPYHHPERLRSFPPLKRLAKSLRIWPKCSGSGLRSAKRPGSIYSVSRFGVSILNITIASRVPST